MIVDANKIALVTGGTGFVGSNITRRLVKEGWAVKIISIPNDNYMLLNDVIEKIKFYEHDGSTENMYDIMADSQPTVVFHLASLFLVQHLPKDIKGLIQSNILFGTQLVDSMIANGVYNLINTGTSWQHYENASYNPVCLYAATKQAFEDILQYYVEAKALKVITLKLFDTYGPGDPRPKLFHLLSKLATSQEPLAMSPGEQLIDLVHVADVVQAYMVAANRLMKDQVLQHECYGVSSGNPISLKELVGIYRKTTNMKLPIQWGERAYRNREVMVPWNGYQIIPEWQPKISLPAGIESLQNEKMWHL